jgi:hypothetical protein
VVDRRCRTGLDGCCTRDLHTIRAHGGSAEVQALHNHWLSDSPRLFFVHVWQSGDASTVAHGMRALLDEIGQQASLAIAS